MEIKNKEKLQLNIEENKLKIKKLKIAKYKSNIAHLVIFIFMYLIPLYGMTKLLNNYSLLFILYLIHTFIFAECFNRKSKLNKLLNFCTDIKENVRNLEWQIKMCEYHLKELN